MRLIGFKLLSDTDFMFKVTVTLTFEILSPNQ